VYLTFKHVNPPRLPLNYQNQTRDLSSARMRVPFRQVRLMRPPTSRPSLAAKGGGGQGHRTVHGQEAGEVEAGLVQIRARGQGRPWFLQGLGWLGCPEGLSHGVLGTLVTCPR
jgi:hypothetical protein